VAFWWVNHKQTYRQETDGGYLWSPKANANGAKNISYDNLTRCQIGDVVFSYANGRINQLGLVEQKASTAQKPAEFDSTGDYWGAEGWLVMVNWQPLQKSLVPITYFELLQPLLPKRYSPISTNTGRGNQGIYLAELSEYLGELLLKLIEEYADHAIRVELLILQEDLARTTGMLSDLKDLEAITGITEKEALIKARLGQGLFRRRVSILEPSCRVTGLANQQFLVASHIKPWRACDNAERLTGANGLLLSPHIDKLFDRYWISFNATGELLCEHEAAKEALRYWGINGANLIRSFNREQESFLKGHREQLRY